MLPLFWTCQQCMERRTDPEKRLKACGRCKQAYYCSKECQKLAWPEHKRFCSRVRTGSGDAEYRELQRSLQGCLFNIVLELNIVLRSALRLGTPSSLKNEHIVRLTFVQCTNQEGVKIHVLAFANVERIEDQIQRAVAAGDAEEEEGLGSLKRALQTPGSGGEGRKEQVGIIYCVFGEDDASSGSFCKLFRDWRYSAPLTPLCSSQS
ncbi:hypothetical protein BCR35DRAFT_96635 [Leucosporidium creatinivorum]|uniref:MYND-type domain-containing protein n=1 Tax=Leucosporidium creatinivorum TaxID=106004 RepID=A0A1Y2F740_9BASI|nr:hypothetical protein BCR35DRAFT_96635 [Leucosporidium creatinivorum]